MTSQLNEANKGNSSTLNNNAIENDKDDTIITVLDLITEKPTPLESKQVEKPPEKPKEVKEAKTFKQKVKDWLPTFKHEIKFSEMPANVRKNIDSSAKNIHKFTQHLTDLICKLDKNVDDYEALRATETILGFLLTSIAIWRAQDMTERLLIASAYLCTSHSLSKAIASDFVDRITSIGKIRDPIRPDIQTENRSKIETRVQMKDEVDTEHIVTTFGKVLAHTAGIGEPDGKLDEKRLKKLGGLGSAIRGVQDLVKFLFKCIETSYIWVWEWYFGYPYEFKDTKEVQDTIIEVVKRSNELKAFSDQDREKKRKDIEYYYSLLDLQQKIFWIDEIRGAKKNKSSKIDYAPFNTACAFIKAEITATSLAINSVEHRNIPTWVHLHGEPNQGKTGVMEILTQYFVQEVLKKDIKRDDMTYVKTDPKFWPKYKGQPIVIFDDAYQKDNLEETANFSNDMVHLKNNVILPLPQADVDSKGGVFFTSPMIISSANKLPSQKAFGIKSPLAILRRIDIFIRVALKDGVDIDSMEEMDPDIYDLYLCPRSAVQAGHYNTTRKDVPITWTQLFDLIDYFHDRYTKEKLDLRSQAEALIKKGMFKREPKTNDIIDINSPKKLVDKHVEPRHDRYEKKPPRFHNRFQKYQDEEEEEEEVEEDPEDWEYEPEYEEPPKLELVPKPKPTVWAKKGETKIQMKGFQYAHADIDGYCTMCVIRHYDAALFKPAFQTMRFAHYRMQKEFEFKGCEKSEPDCYFEDDDHLRWGLCVGCATQMQKDFLAHDHRLLYLYNGQTVGSIGEYDRFLNRFVTNITLHNVGLDPTLPYKCECDDPNQKCDFCQWETFDEEAMIVTLQDQFLNFLTVLYDEEFNTWYARSFEMERIPVKYIPDYPRTQMMRGFNQFIDTSYFMNMTRQRPTGETYVCQDDCGVKHPIYETKSIAEATFTVPKIFIVMGAIVGLFAGIYALYRVLKALELPIFANGGWYESSSPVTRKGGKVSKAPIAAQGSKATLDIGRKIAENNCFILAKQKNNSGPSLWCLGLYDNVIIVPKHFLDSLETSIEVVLKPRKGATKEYTFLWKDCEHVELADKDIMAVKLPITNLNFTHIRDHLPVEAQEVEDALTSPVSFIKIYNETIEPQHLRCANFLTELQYTQYTKGDTLAKEVLQLHCDGIVTEDGDCGQIYVSHNNKLAHKLLGYHIAGNSKDFAYCQILWRDIYDFIQAKWPTNETKGQMKRAFDYESIKKEIKQNLQDAIGDDPMSKKDEPDFKPPEEMAYKVLPRKKAARTPNRSQIVDSLIVNKIIPKTRDAACLRPVKRVIDGNIVKVSPAEKAIKKNVVPVVKMTPSDENLLRECMRVAVEMNPKRVSGNPNKLEDALNCPPGYTEVNPIFVDTSAGGGMDRWDLKHLNKKHPFIEVDLRGHRTATSKLEAAVAKLWYALLYENDDYILICIDYLKDELRTIDRVEDVKTRLFSSLPVEFLALFRCLMLDNTEDMMRNHNTSPYALGVNPHSAEWRRTFDYLTDNGNEYRRKHAISQDAKSFDASTQNKTHEIYIDERMKRYEKEDKLDKFELLPGLMTTKDERAKVRRRMLVLIFSIGETAKCKKCWHIFMNVLYQSDKGNPSGQPETTPSNSIVLWACDGFCACKFANNQLQKYPSVDFIMKEVLRGKTFGDDDVETFTEYLDGYGNGGRAHYMKLVGYTMTDSKKGEIIYDPVTLQSENNVWNINEIEFLKRMFREDKDGCIYAPLDIKHISDMTNHRTTTHSPEVGTLLSAGGALLEYYMWGREVFEYYRDLINIALEEQGLKPYKIEFWELKARFCKDKVYTPLQIQIPFINPFPDIDSIEKVDRFIKSTRAISYNEDSMDVKLLDEEASMAAYEYDNKRHILKEVNEEASKIAVQSFNKALSSLNDIHESPKKIRKTYFDPNARTQACNGMFRNIPRQTGDFPLRRPVSQPRMATIKRVAIKIKEGIESKIEDQITAWKYDKMVGNTGRFIVRGCIGLFIPSFIVGFWLTMVILGAQGLQGDGLNMPPVKYFPERRYAVGNNARFHYTYCDYEARCQMMVDDSCINPGTTKGGTLGLGEDSPPGKEQAKKSKTGLISGIMRAASGIASAFSFIPSIGPVASISSAVFKAGQLIAGYFGYDYPTNVASTDNFRVVQTSSLALASGLDTIDHISMDPANGVSTESKFFLEKNGPWTNFAIYRLRPGLILTQSFDSTAIPNEVILNIPITPMYLSNNQAANIFTLNPLGNYASMFMFWRGSMKYMFYFTTSKFISCRVRLEWHPKAATIGMTDNSNVGDIVSLTVDINGDTDFPVMIPFLSNYHWNKIIAPDAVHTDAIDNGNNGHLVLVVVNPPVVSNTDFDSTVWIAVDVAGGEDFECARPNELFPDYEYGPTPSGPHIVKGTYVDLEAKTQAKATRQEQFLTQFKPMTNSGQGTNRGVTMGEAVQGFIDLFHRYTKISDLNMNTAQNQHGYACAWNQSGIMFNQWMQMLNSFMFHRGNIRYKLIDENRLAGTNGPATTNVYLGNVSHNPDTQGENVLFPPYRQGVTFNNQAFRTTNETEVPFYCPMPFISWQNPTDMTDWPELIVTTMETSLATHLHHFSVYVATSDCYSMGVPIAPGYLISPISPKKKLKVVDNNARTQMKQGEHGNEERKVVETTIQENQQLSGFRDTVGIKSDHHTGITPVHQGTNPYPDQGLREVLSRPYLVGDITWSGTDDVGDMIFEGSFPYLLLVPNIIAKLNYFQYFRAGVHVEMRLNSTTFHAGRLIIVYCPHWNPANATGIMSEDDMYSLSCLDSIILSANANETIAFDIPYVSPTAYWDTDLDVSTSAPNAGIFGTFKVFVLAPLMLTGSLTTPSIQVSVYANFTNPEVTGFTPVAMSMVRVKTSATSGHSKKKNENKSNSKALIKAKPNK